jgi:putative peptidoglycan lipid II flippase
MTTNPTDGETPNRREGHGFAVPRLFSGLRVVASSTLLSRVLGLVRDVATAGLFGLGPVMDAFAFAFRIPNLTRRLFGEGALSAAFLPAFARELERSSDLSLRASDRQVGNLPHDSAWQLASAVFALLAVLLGLVVLGGELLLWLLSYWFAGHAHTQLLLGLTAVMLPYALLICLAAQVTAVLHALGHFTWPALVPVALNVVWLATIWFVDPYFEPDREAQAYALAVCVVFAGVLQLGMQWPALRRCGFRFNFGWGKSWPAVKDVVRAMVPVTLGLSITQINTLLDSLIAWSFTRPDTGAAFMPLPGGPRYPLEPGAVSALYYGERVYQFPLGVFGVALGTVLFPLLARHAARGEFDKLRHDLTLGLRLVIVIGLPASVGLVLVADPLARTLFQRGQFTALDAARTAKMVTAYGSGVWAYCAVPILYRAFYALGERAVTVRIGGLAVLVDFACNLTLIWPLAERGLAWSTALTAIFHVGLLLWFLQHRLGRLEWPLLGRTALRAGLATVAMSIGCAATQQFVPRGVSSGGRAIELLVPILAAVAVYFAAARLLRLDEFWMLFRRESPESTGAADDL